ncbi:PhoD-like phosphatase [Variovorax sp. OK605]|uniref:alkaline phosphatase D family protein n=1 Tax=Variovorax sp. OK605 TaxID=1855317 RepID=UPI0008EB3156|nr:alkaline phosphatase D family protein [Variovorax sp. OK605]SFQ51429.1 PhoD-like phosphatase [Variovorax sp. OK605]
MKIAFTSCMNFRSGPKGSQRVWNRIAEQQPDYLFLLGDQIYMDFFPDLGEPAEWDVATFEQKMTGHYTDQWGVPNFKLLFDALRQQQDNGGGVYGTWDDHDFAWNNVLGAKVDPAVKAVSRKLFRQFMQIEQVPLQKDGIYYAIPLFHEQQKIGKAIFLDTRWNREKPGDHSALIGDKQFDFLAQELANETGFVLICAGTPIRATGDGWMRYSDEYARLRSLTFGRKTIFLSGDIHENSFVPPGGSTKFFEIVSSGAFVTKYKFAGDRENFGILDFSPERTDVKLFDIHGLEHHKIIDNASFDYQELK